MAVLNAAKVDTTPGNDAVCPFSPPLGWEGDSAAYMVLMRSRYTDLMHGHMYRTLSGKRINNTV